MVLRAIPLIALGLLGCNPQDHAVDHAPPLTRAVELGRGGGPQASPGREDAIERVAAARCDKLKDCPSTLADRYQTADVCLGRERARLQNMWRDEKCPRIDQGALEACANAARAERCDQKSESLYTPIIGACAPTAICPAQ